jgi:sigma-B regulation protein RsbU (phosphoserine phosphatase)
MPDDRLRKLASEMREREEATRSMKLASVRQQRMLPDAPAVDGYDIQISYRPASTISGDFYDFFATKGGNVGIAIGDVTGHGVEAGIVMGTAKTAINIYGRQMENPSEVMRAVNTDMFKMLDGKTFVSVAYAVLDPGARTIRFVRAGQNRPFLYNAGWKTEGPREIRSNGLALGVDKGPKFDAILQEVSVQLAEGDVFFQYTDGLTEAANQTKEQFGEPRLAETLKRYARLQLRELINLIDESLRDFTRTTEFDDDITMVAVKVR